MSTVELAQRIGVSDSYISMLETGKRDCPDGKKLFDLASALKCDFSELTDNEDLLLIATGMYGSPKNVREESFSYGDCPKCREKEKEILWLRDQLAKALDRIPKAQ